MRNCTTLVPFCRPLPRKLGGYLVEHTLRPVQVQRPPAVHFSIQEQLLGINVERFRAELVLKPKIVVSLNSRLDRNKQEEGLAAGPGSC